MSSNTEIRKERGGKSVGIFWVQAFFLYAIWLLFSGKFDFFHMGAGVLAVFLVLWLDRKLGPVNLREGDLPIRVHPVRAPLYISWLIGQMLLSSWQVARIILSPAMLINPVVISFTSPQPHTIARVTFGNSITLTPGTLTLNIEGDRYWVHALTDEMKEGLIEGTMQRKVAGMFCGEIEGPLVLDVRVTPRETGRRFQS